MQRISVLVAAVWLSIVIMAFSWNALEQSKSHTELAFSTSHAFFRQVELTRNWNASHGGVYVLVTDKTRPNPYLEVDNRDLTSNNGVALTKVNPAYMTRQIAEIASQEEGMQFHITSLNPIRPKNKARNWEETFLRRFQQGSLEEGEFVSEGGREFFRYMAPLHVKKSCLPCHVKQGYKIGDIRGGISVTMPQFKTPPLKNLALGYGVVGIMGALLILWGGRLIEKKQNNLETVNEELSDLNKWLVDSEERYRSLSDAAFEGVLLSKKGVVIEANKALRKMLNYQSPEVVGQKLIEFISEEEREKVKANIFNNYEEPYETLLLKKDGSVLPVEISAQMCMYKGEEVRVSAIRDLTEKKKAEEEIQNLQGIIPICSHCKEIRDDKGYWNKLENYIQKHSEAVFSHSICDICLDKYYPDEEDDD